MSLILCACGEKITSGDIRTLDWGTIGEKADEIYTNKEIYPMMLSVNYNLDEQNNEFNII